MTKAEFLKAIESMPDDCEVVWHDGKGGYTSFQSVDTDGVLIYLEEQYDATL